MNRLVCALMPLVLLGGCGAWRSDPRAADDPQFARTLARTATIAAVAKPGARVCREMQVGIAERDWVRGVVVEADGAKVKIRVDEPGRFRHVIAGAEVSKGATIADDALAWTPCL